MWFQIRITEPFHLLLINSLILEKYEVQQHLLLQHGMNSVRNYFTHFSSALKYKILIIFSVPGWDQID